MERQAWSDHALHCGFIARSSIKSWMKHGKNWWYPYSDDRARRRLLPAHKQALNYSAILNPPSSTAYFLYNCLINPLASISFTRLRSTKARGSAPRALGFVTARSSSMVFTPSGVG